jgi:hypothetical protein
LILVLLSDLHKPKPRILHIFSLNMVRGSGIDVMDHLQPWRVLFQERLALVNSRIPIPILSIQICAAIQQDLNDLLVSALKREHQRGVQSLIPGIDVGTSSQKKFDKVRCPLITSVPQHWHPLVVTGIHVNFQVNVAGMG